MASPSALFGPLYTCRAGSIAVALDELAPSIYPDGMITARNSWYLMANAVSGQLAVRRGLAADQDRQQRARTERQHDLGQRSRRLRQHRRGRWLTGFTAGLGGMAAGIDMPVAGTARVGVAVGTVEGQTWSQASDHANSSTAQFVTYGQWQRGMFFAEAQLGLMYQQEDVHRALPLFGASTRGDANGLAGGGGVRIGLQQTIGAWLIEPSVGFGGFHLHLGSVAENRWGAGGEHRRRDAGQRQSTLAVSAQRAFALSETCG